MGGWSGERAPWLGFEALQAIMEVVRGSEKAESERDSERVEAYFWIFDR